MYNIRRSATNSSGNQYNFRKQQQQKQQQQQQQPQTMPHVATFVTSKVTNQAQVQHQNHQQPMQNMSLHNLPPQSRGPQMHTPTSISPPVAQFSEVPTTQDLNNTKIETDDVKPAEEQDTEKTDIKWPPKRKINKKEQKKRLNARMRRLICPKSPLMVFSELYKDVPIQLESTTRNNYLFYTAFFTVDGETYRGEHTSRSQAKQKACENFLRLLLAKKMGEQSSKKEDITDVEMEDSENGTTSKSKGPPQEDFPWPHFASLAMHNLMNHWEIQPTTKVVSEETSIKPAPKVGGMKKFPQNPEIYNPVQLLHQMIPGIKFTERIISTANPSVFEIKCELNQVVFKGQGSTKKSAKKECAIAAIKHLWNFDFHAVRVNKGQ